MNYSDDNDTTGNRTQERFDRYTCFDLQVDDLPSRIRACHLLGLKFFVKEQGGTHEVRMFLFYDDAGMRNFMRGFYD